MDSHAIVARILVAHRDQPGALLPVLHEIQDALGFIPPDTVPGIAAALNLSRAEVHGVSATTTTSAMLLRRATSFASAAPKPVRRWAARRWRNTPGRASPEPVWRWSLCIAWAYVPAGRRCRWMKPNCMPG